MGSIGRFALQAWLDLDQDPERLALIRPAESGVALPSSLPVGELALDSVAVASLAATGALEARTARRAQSFELSPDRITTAFQSERHFRVDGEAPSIWASMSGFWQARDGWVRTHGNYAHHAAAMADVLSIAVDAAPTVVERAVAERSRFDLEEAAAEKGAVIAAVRTHEEWSETLHSRAVASTPLVGARVLGGSPSREWTPDAVRPLEGVRVLDLTRVIAGPVCTRTLAYLGAEVLRLDSPHLAEPLWQHLDTGAGKRSALIDLTSPRGRRVIGELLDEADVLVHGYRPGALDEFGLAPEVLAESHPGLIVGQVSAWGLVGPWSRRRGFDSIVQAASGIAMRESLDGVKPGAMPAQALDHSAGYFLAAAVCAALVRQREWGGTHHVDVSLARLAAELLTTPGTTSGATLSEPTLDSGDSPVGVVTCAAPAVEFPGAMGRFPRMAGRLGGDDAVWNADREVVR